jgi:toxin secretion/phage lysis holin
MNMEEKLMGLKAVLAAACSAIGAFLGWQGIMALVWVTVMALDYVSGTAAACKTGQWSSAVARAGLWHKGGMILVVCAGVMADCVLAVMCAHLPIELDWQAAVTPLVLGWYILTELGSILENAVKMGAHVPGWLVGLLQTGLEAMEPEQV